MSTKPVMLILGAGPRIGTSVASAFAAVGYNIALASRKGTNAINDLGQLHLQADFTNPDSIPDVFAAVVEHFSIPPTVVVYNAASLTPPPDNANVLSVPASGLAKDLNVNVVSAYVAAQEAVKGWRSLSQEAKKTFIYTGNAQASMIVPVPMMFTLGVGKAGSAYWIGQADHTYRSAGYRFFYADERTADGKIKGRQLSGPAHGECYTALAEHDDELPWHATFVEGKGFVAFQTER